MSYELNIVCGNLNGVRNYVIGLLNGELQVSPDIEFANPFVDWADAMYVKEIAARSPEFIDVEVVKSEIYLGHDLPTPSPVWFVPARSWRSIKTVDLKTNTAL